MTLKRLREASGEGWLEPVWFEPHTKLNNQIQLMLDSCDDLLLSWRDEDFREAVTEFRMFNRQMVIVNTPAGVKHVLQSHNDNYERKSPQMRRALEFLIGDGLIIADGQAWTARRALVVEILGKGRVAEFGPVMAQTARDMADHWASRDVSIPLDVHAEMGVLTTEIIARTLFGVPLGRERAQIVIASFAEYQRCIDSFNLGYLLGLDEGWPVWKGMKLRRATRRIQQITDEIIADHLHRRTDGPTLSGMLALRQTQLPGSPTGRDAFRDEAATLFLAGHESTASILAWALYLLAKAPWAEEALLRELRTVCGDRPPEFGDVAQLHYCRAVIEETMRLYPPVAILGRQARAYDHVEGVKVEPGAMVMVAPWLLHRSPDLWGEPNRFIPERFLGEARPAKYVYVPFALGPRVCPGMNFGMTESVLCLATLAQRFKVQVAADTVVAPQCRLTLRPKYGVPMMVIPR